MLTAVFVGGAAGAAPSSVHTATASLGTWQARLTYTLAGSGYARHVTRLRLRVAHAGALVREGSVPLPKDCREYPCAASPAGGDKLPFELSDLDVASGPVAIISFWTGGAHCCSVVRLVSLGDNGTIDRNFGDPGAVPTTLGGHRVLRSADDRFAYLFTSYVASGLPVQIWRFTGQALVDVTRDYPAEVRADAAGWWQLYREQRRLKAIGETRGVFAAWAADVCLLGQRAKVEAAIAAGVARGDFSGGAASDMLGPHGARYGKQLRARLSAWGYCR
jgi:hypothetical protein